MKTVITSSGYSVKSQFDLRFGRAAWYCIYDDKADSVTFYENNFIDNKSDAGTKAANKMVEWNIQRIISGDFGIKAKTILDKHQIQLVILENKNYTVDDLLNKLKH
ncbi:NifB/NifX family molybdenum-iron cluster-binding protein [Abyssalbus ytuae]|uniref:NifB/NifX family molybdenum-iron cluster-binding protein n=1 Tax=Abyssalbus ytuae TaxID=2926907 RepID=A0A9E6ZR13_9FLAO|nr:NifB/NifX family molybdenum-iron cluster-binding protein [Abyssalbus ytuae]UOB19339.1 NifB/NifX family molybdenum-iron cluster-binding protein [Abyssalbus ytuae]